MAGRPVLKLSVCFAVSQSARAICEKSGRGSHTAIMNATPFTAKAPLCFLPIGRAHHERTSPCRKRSASTAIDRFSEGANDTRWLINSRCTSAMTSLTTSLTSSGTFLGAVCPSVSTENVLHSCRTFIPAARTISPFIVLLGRQLPGSEHQSE